MEAADKPEVPLRERAWNERSIAKRRENTGVYWVLLVNARGIR
jgi:hypothetical protein